MSITLTYKKLEMTIDKFIEDTIKRKYEALSGYNKVIKYNIIRELKRIYPHITNNHYKIVKSDRNIFKNIFDKFLTLNNTFQISIEKINSTNIIIDYEAIGNYIFKHVVEPCNIIIREYYKDIYKILKYNGKDFEYQEQKIGDEYVADHNVKKKREGSDELYSRLNFVLSCDGKNNKEIYNQFKTFKRNNYNLNIELPTIVDYFKNNHINMDNPNSDLTADMYRNLLIHTRNFLTRSFNDCFATISDTDSNFFLKIHGLYNIMKDIINDIDCNCPNLKNIHIKNTTCGTANISNTYMNENFNKDKLRNSIFDTMKKNIREDTFDKRNFLKELTVILKSVTCFLGWALRGR